MRQTRHEAKATVGEALNDLPEDSPALDRREADAVRPETREQPQQELTPFGLLGPAGCLGVLSGTAPLGEVPDQPED